MHACTKGTPARTSPAISADKITRTIAFLEGCLIDAEEERDKHSDQARSFYAGRAGGIALAISYLREVAQ